VSCVHYRNCRRAKPDYRLGAKSGSRKLKIVWIKKGNDMRATEKEANIIDSLSDERIKGKAITGFMRVFSAVQ